MYYTAASPPPQDVVATQSSSSAPVEVSWVLHLMQLVASLHGYRIYYGKGQNVFVLSVAIITSIWVWVDGNYIGQNVSICSEADQLYSELVCISVIDSKLFIVHSAYTLLYFQWSPKVYSNK